MLKQLEIRAYLRRLYMLDLNFLPNLKMVFVCRKLRRIHILNVIKFHLKFNTDVANFHF